MKNDTYIVNETFYMTESKNHIYISVDRKHYKLNYSTSLRQEIDTIIREIKLNIFENSTKHNKNMLDYLFRINAIKTYNEEMPIVLKLFDQQDIISDRIYELSKEDTRYKVEYIKTGYLLKILNNGKYLCISKNKVLMSGTECKEVSEAFLRYIVEVVLDKYFEIENLNIDESKLLLINLTEYSNELLLLYENTFNFDSNIFLNEKLNTYCYEFIEYFPIVKLDYENFLGDMVTTFGEDKEECKYNLYLKLKNMYDGLKIHMDHKSKLTPLVFKDILSLYFNFNDIETNNKLNNGLVFENIIRKYEKENDKSAVKYK